MIANPKLQSGNSKTNNHKKILKLKLPTVLWLFLAVVQNVECIGLVKNWRISESWLEKGIYVIKLCKLQSQKYFFCLNKDLYWNGFLIKSIIFFGKYIVAIGGLPLMVGLTLTWNSNFVLDFTFFGRHHKSSTQEAYGLQQSHFWIFCWGSDPILQPGFYVKSKKNHN